MPLSDTLLPEFDHEMATTRTVLERVPEAHAAWKPHAKSTSLGDLAMHLASIPGWTVPTLTRTELDMAPPGGPPYTPPVFTSLTATLALFTANVAVARAAIAATPDDAYGVPWSLKVGDHLIFTQPRGAVLRSFVLSHIIHHRGQLTVYLRMKDVPLPSVYGPTADERN
jgi:uncharacterized damage-inducible protein DinB